MSLEYVIVHIRIEEENKIRDRVEKAKEFSSKANVVKSNTSWPKNKRNRQFNKSNNHNKFKDKIPSFKKKGNCFVCGKSGHHAAQCRHRHKLGDENPPKANLVHGDEIISAVVVSQVNMVVGNNEWVVDSRATKHICVDKNAFYDYIPVREGEEQVFMGDSRPAPVMGKGKVLLKLTYGKTLSLRNVLHVPDIRYNLVSVYVLSNAGVRVSFEGKKFVITKNEMFVGKMYCSNELLMLNVLNVIINNNTSSSTYIIDSVD